ncbi:MAG TPA: type I DNA topoisomerase [Thermoanaerobaculia bacterium]|nr:type I DNA topoisomerase [Thermoanaerobaculia bacterium]
MGKALVIVESPAKARTISRYLGPGYEVESSIGHVRDLPSTAAEIPARIKKEPWARLGVDVDHDFEAVYIVPRSKQAQVKKLKQALEGADELLLATDEDREGEAIAWHLREVLAPRVPVRRMVFSEITRSAIERAMESTRDIDERLVEAQEARRVLDRLYGYEVSPVLWKKVRPKLSAGRVQSVATRLVVERERARMTFVASDYWDLEAELSKAGGAPFKARLAELDGARVASSRDFDESTGELRPKEGVVLLDEAAARTLVGQLEGARYRVAEVKEKPFTRRPYPPFITSTLQQEASRKLRFGAQRTMRVAQGLYENGYITYMRTDSVQLSPEALEAARDQIRELYGSENLPAEPRRYARASKSAQEAHEAIRPAGRRFREPEEVRGELDADAFRLYELIWKRTVASQMKDATGLSTSVRIDAPAGERTATFAASGRVLHFPGFLRAYVEGSDDPRAELEDQERVLPELAAGDAIEGSAVEALGHTTQPPPRFTEASLVKELEERGIGRPSTYASILQTIQDRGYVWKKGTALVPTWTAFAVTRLLEQHLGDLVDFDFTARMEADLDAIARGERASVPWLSEFYFGGGEDGEADPGLKSRIGSGWEEIDARAVSSIELGRDPESGGPVAVRVGRYGPYLQVGDSEPRVTLRDDIPPDELTLERALELLAQGAQQDRPLGEDPETGKSVYLKSGRFGDYVQLGDPQLDDKGKPKKGAKPKMASLWPSMDRDSLTLDEALMLLAFPRELGIDRESGEPITAQDGRYGPYLKRGSDTRSLASHEELATVDLERALELFRQPKARRGARAQSNLSALGVDPRTQLELVVKSGRFGPYVTDGTVNASLPKGRDPETLTLEQACELIAAREQKLRDQGKDPRAAGGKASRGKGRRKKKTSS